MDKSREKLKQLLIDIEEVKQDIDYNKDNQLARMLESIYEIKKKIGVRNGEPWEWTKECEELTKNLEKHLLFLGEVHITLEIISKDIGDFLNQNQ